MTFNEPKLPRPNEISLQNINDIIPAEGTPPSGRPRKFAQQFRIVSGVFYFFDSLLNDWYSTTAVATPPGGNDTYVQYNDGGVFGGDFNFTWDKANQLLTLFAKTAASGDIALQKLQAVVSAALHELTVAFNYSNTYWSLTAPGTDMFFQFKNLYLGPNLSTTATNGFAFMPTCSGPPTGVPAGTFTGKAFIYDTDNDDFYVYNGGWKKVHLT